MTKINLEFLADSFQNVYDVYDMYRIQLQRQPDFTGAVVLQRVTEATAVLLPDNPEFREEFANQLIQFASEFCTMTGQAMIVEG